MILETLRNSVLLEGVHPLFPKAFAWLGSYDPATADGRYEIDGSELVAIVQRYETAPAADWFFYVNGIESPSFTSPRRARRHSSF